MDRNTLLAVGLSLLVISTWMTWDANQRKQLAGERSESSPVEQSPQTESSPELGRQVAEVPDALPGTSGTTLAPSPIEEWTIDRPQYRAILSSEGATIREWVLKDYVTRPDEGGELVRVIEVGEGPGAFATPLPELGLGSLERVPFRLVEHSATHWLLEYEDDGVRIRKQFGFDTDDTYGATLSVSIENLARPAIRPRFGIDLPASARAEPDFSDAALTALVADEMERTPVASLGGGGFLGGLFGGGSEPQFFDSDVRWVGINSRYFLAALVPKVTRSAAAEFRPVSQGKGLGILAYPEVVIPQGGSLAYDYRLFVGPKVPVYLENFDEENGTEMGLERAIDRGWFWVAPLTDAFTQLLDWGYRIVPNYGVVIVLLTVLLRVVMAPLTAKQMRAMKKSSARMAHLQPKMKEIQEKYKDDTQRRNEETMKLYKEAGVNPLTMMGGGCLPMLLQLPVFIALYYALQSAIELRQAPFGLWIQDLSIPETLFTIPGLELPVRVLPLAMGASMVLQQKMTPTPSMDPAQARMMMTMMPIMFTVLFYGFPSGLVLYWFVSNLLAIGQQYWVNRGAAPA